MDPVGLTVQLLALRCGAVFGRGFQLRAIGQRLYVQIAGRKVPLYLDYDSEPAAVQQRATQLRDFLKLRLGRYDSATWRRFCLGESSGRREKALSRNELLERWRRLKLAEGVDTWTIERQHLVRLQQLSPIDPLSEESLLRAIESTPPRTQTRRRMVALLKRVCQAHGAEWNAPLLEPLRGGVPARRPQAFFTDEEIERIMTPGSGLGDSWRRVIGSMAAYGLRPWEAWVAEPCRVRAGCLWIPIGKTTARGTTKPRQVPPFHPEWNQQWNLPRLIEQAPLPALSHLRRAGDRTSARLREHGLATEPRQTAYGFRHAYARRLHSPRYRVSDAHAALFMGHTVAVHHKAYSEWLGGDDPIGVYFDRPG